MSLKNIEAADLIDYDEDRARPAEKVMRTVQSLTVDGIEYEIRMMVDSSGKCHAEITDDEGEEVVAVAFDVFKRGASLLARALEVS